MIFVWVTHWQLFGGGPASDCGRLTPQIGGCTTRVDWLQVAGACGDFATGFDGHLACGLAGREVSWACLLFGRKGSNGKEESLSEEKSQGPG